MNIIPDGSYDIISQAGESIGNIVDYLSNIITYSSLMLSFSLDSEVLSDIHFITSDQSISIISGNSYEIAIELTCSSSGSTSIIYHIATYHGEQLPSWLSLDSKTGILSIVAPNSLSITTYNFYALTYISGYSDPIQKLIIVLMMLK